MTQSTSLKNSFLLIGFLTLSINPRFSSLHAQQPASGRQIRIAIIGDSTVANYKATDVLRGWGQMLPEFFRPETHIDNFAENGRSTKTFLMTPHWQQALNDKPPLRRQHMTPHRHVNSIVYARGAHPVVTHYLGCRRVCWGRSPAQQPGHVQIVCPAWHAHMPTCMHIRKQR